MSGDSKSDSCFLIHINLKKKVPVGTTANSLGRQPWGCGPPASPEPQRGDSPVTVALFGAARILTRDSPGLTPWAIDFRPYRGWVYRHFSVAKNPSGEPEISPSTRFRKWANFLIIGFVLLNPRVATMSYPPGKGRSRSWLQPYLNFPRCESPFLEASLRVNRWGLEAELRGIAFLNGSLGTSGTVREARVALAARAFFCFPCSNCFRGHLVTRPIS